MKNTIVIILLSLVFSFGCSKKSSSIPADHNDEALILNADFYQHPEEIKMYNSWQANAETIKKCAFAQTAKDSCSIKDSPLIGIGKSNLSVEDILNKTMTSNPIYIDTFRAVLNSMPKESLMMFGSVNAVVISERILPSYYTYQSGAIYLSASYFWKTPEEKAAATPKRDFRESFGVTLQFTETSDYVKNQKSIYQSSRAKYRTNAELGPMLIRLIFHELAHANDFFPKNFYNSNDLDISKSYYETTDARWEKEQVISQKLKSNLKSDIMLKLGEVLFQGADPTKRDLDTTAYVVVEEFKNDVASDIYAYSTPREDLAMLVEKNLMYFYLNYTSYTVFIKYPHANFEIPENYTYPIAGGIKNKIADPRIKERTRDVLEHFFDVNFAERVIGSLDDLKSTDIPEDADWDKIEQY